MMKMTRNIYKLKIQFNFMDKNVYENTFLVAQKIIDKFDYITRYMESQERKEILELIRSKTTIEVFTSEEIKKISNYYFEHFAPQDNEQSFEYFFTLLLDTMKQKVDIKESDSIYQLFIQLQQNLHLQKEFLQSFGRTRDDPNIRINSKNIEQFIRLNENFKQSIFAIRNSLQIKEEEIKKEQPEILKEKKVKTGFFSKKRITIPAIVLAASIFAIPVYHAVDNTIEKSTIIAVYDKLENQGPVGNDIKHLLLQMESLSNGHTNENTIKQARNLHEEIRRKMETMQTSTFTESDKINPIDLADRYLKEMISKR